MRRSIEFGRFVILLHFVNLLRSGLFFFLITQGFQSVLDDGSFVIPKDSKSQGLELASKEQKEKPSRDPSSVIEVKSKKTVLDFVEDLSNLCGIAGSGKGLNFKTPTSYLSSVLKKAGAVDPEDPIFYGSADSIWEDYLSKNNFVDVSESGVGKNEFDFKQLANGTLIVLEKNCFEEGTVAIYCDGKYFATKFVNPASLLKKVNSKKHKCQMGKGLRIVVKQKKSHKSGEKTLAKAY